MVFERIKFLASNVSPKPNETTYWVDISANPYGGVIKYYDGYDWIKLDQDSIAEDYVKLRNKPTLNGVTIEGNKTSEDYHIPTPESVENVLNEFRQEIEVIDNKVSDTVEKLDNYIESNDGNIEDIKSDIQQIQESLDLILGESASEVIDKFNEILKFLEGYEDSTTLKEVLNELEQKLTTLINSVNEQLTKIDNHINNTNNPHNVTKAQIGLDQVDNTSDMNKPVSTLVQYALDYEANLRDEMDQELINRINNLSQTVQETYIPLTQKGASNGVATLDQNGLVPSQQLPSYVDDVIECYATYTKAEDGTLSNIELFSDVTHTIPIVGESGKIYIDITDATTFRNPLNNLELLSATTHSQYQFRWTGTQFAVVGAPTVIGEVTGTAFDGGRGKALEDKTNSHVINTNNPHNVTTQQIGAIPTGGLKTINMQSLEGQGNIEIKNTADDVLFTTDLTITANVGVHTIGSSGSKTLPTTGKSVKQVMDILFASEKNPSITQPYVNITLTGAGAKEVGTMFTPSYSASLNPGSYQFGPATGVTATSWNITDTNGGTKDTATGSFNQFQVIDNTNYKVTAQAQHTEGAIPVTNLGNNYESGKINAGSKSRVSSTVTGYRNSFYGTLTNKNELTSDAIRTLTKSNRALSNGATFNISIPVGALRVVIAYPATLRTLTSVLDVNGLNAQIVSSFTESRINVEGLNAYQAIEYKVYTLDYANPNDTKNTYKVTI